MLSNNNTVGAFDSSEQGTLEHHALICIFWYGEGSGLHARNKEYQE